MTFKTGDRVLVLFKPDGLVTSVRFPSHAEVFGLTSNNDPNWYTVFIGGHGYASVHVRNIRHWPDAVPTCPVCGSQVRLVNGKVEAHESGNSRCYGSFMPA